MGAVSVVPCFNKGTSFAGWFIYIDLYTVFLGQVLSVLNLFSRTGFQMYIFKSRFIHVSNCDLGSTVIWQKLSCFHIVVLKLV